MNYLITRNSSKNVFFSSLFLFASITSSGSFADNSIVDNSKLSDVVIYRTQDKSALNYRLTVDGKNIGKLKRGKEIHLQLSTGLHTISSSSPHKSTYEVLIDNQQTNAIKISINKKNRLILEQEIGGKLVSL